MTLDSISSKKSKVTIKVYSNTDSGYDKTYEGYYITDTNSLIYEDGSPMAIPYNDSIEFDTEYVTTHDTFPLSNNDLLNTISSLTLCEQLTKHGHLIDIILYVVVYIICMLAFIIPNKIFFLFTSWLYEEPNLSETGVKVIKGASVALLLNAMLFFTIK